jgi:hypothetical protein
VDEIGVDEKNESEAGDFDDGVVRQFELVSNGHRFPVHVDGALPLVGDEEVAIVFKFYDPLATGDFPGRTLQ